MELLIAAAVIGLAVVVGVIAFRSVKNDKDAGSGGGLNRDEVEK